MKGEEAVWGGGGGGGGGSSPPEANRMKRSQIKWKLLLFDESDFYFFRGQFIFYSLLIDPCLFSRKSRNMYFSLNQIRLSNGQAYKERIIYA